MTKAEERANEKYPLMSEDDKEGLESLKYIGIECDSVYEFNSIRYSQQCYFIEGYQQAEKDLADAFIEKACSWIRTHSEVDYFEFIPDANYCGAGNLNKKRMIEDFRKAMREDNL